MARPTPCASSQIASTLADVNLHQLAHDVLLLRSRRAIATKMAEHRSVLLDWQYADLRNMVTIQLGMLQYRTYLSWAPRIQPEEMKP